VPARRPGGRRDRRRHVRAGHRSASRSGEPCGDGRPEALDTIGRLPKGTGHELECAEIAGRKFESIGDHAGYLRDGGCARVLDALAAA
jgi:hypothetical protein